jgi:hypothetical protein
LQDVTTEAHDVGAGRGGDVLLACGRTVLEQRHNHIPTDERARLLGPSAGEIRRQLADLIRDRRVQLPSPHLAGRTRGTLHHQASFRVSSMWAKPAQDDRDERTPDEGVLHRPA